MIVVCDGCGEREARPTRPWYRVSKMLGRRPLREWTYCSIRCLNQDTPDTMKGGTMRPA